MKFSDRLMTGIMNTAGKVNDNKIIQSIMDSFVVLNPFIILASIATLFTSLICSPKAGLATVHGFEFLVNFNPMFSGIYYGCMNLIALLLAHNMAYNMAKRSGVEPHFGGLLGLVAYVCMNSTNIAVQGQEGVFAVGLSQDVTGSLGMFYAMVIAVLTIMLYSRLNKVEAFKIKMPDGVPANVGKAFSSLIPTCLTILILAAVRFAYKSLTGSELSNLIYNVLQAPLGSLMQTPFGFIGIALFAGVFWILGIHGTAMTSAFTRPLFLAALTKNIELVNAGLAPTEIVTKPFNVLFGGLGGFGCTLGLIVAILLVSKREDERAIAKIALPAGIFEINEPIIFGLPIVMNPIYAIPFILAPVLGTVIGFVATKVGLMPYTYIDVPWVTPPFINAFLASGGSIMAAVVQFIAFAAIVLLYMPFVYISNRVYEKSLREKDSENNAD
ncbi:MAG: PTS sugar transporter subunit IIC [Solobacterium sp.]|nr:PTS sugar transporter subunit IIC [Solobacterium sp.]